MSLRIKHTYLPVIVVFLTSMPFIARSSFRLSHRNFPITFLDFRSIISPAIMISLAVFPCLSSYETLLIITSFHQYYFDTTLYFSSSPFFINFCTIFSSIHGVVLSANPIRNGTASLAKLTNANASAPTFSMSSLLAKSGQCPVS